MNIKWEYCQREYYRLNGKSSVQNQADQIQSMNALGEQGWEAYHVEQSPQYTNIWFKKKTEQVKIE